MQVSVESTGNLERRVILSLPAGDVDDKVGGRLREMARTARIKGFRPGKVPTKPISFEFYPPKTVIASPPQTMREVALDRHS